MDSEANPSTPQTRGLKKVPSTVQNVKSQKSILGFFQVKSSPTPVISSASFVERRGRQSDGVQQVSRDEARRVPSTMQVPRISNEKFPHSLTPAASSDASDPNDYSDAKRAISEPDEPGITLKTKGGHQKNVNVQGELPSPATSTNGTAGEQAGTASGTADFTRNLRNARKSITSYAESEDEDIVASSRRTSQPGGRALKKRRTVASSSEEDNFVEGDEEEQLSDDDLDDFIVPDDSEEEISPPKKRKRSSQTSSRKRSVEPSTDLKSVNFDPDIPSVESGATAKWSYDPNDAEQPWKHRPSKTTVSENATEKPKQKAHVTEPEKRYPWLASPLDIDKNPPGHPDFDPRTIYIPPLAWAKFSPFEKQYWEIKQKLWDTVVFFKKGKFYELYENDATIGHQLFDLKLTDRVNMRMVGVPEMSLAHWANQFVAKGFKVARVDQEETALGKEMRERGAHPSKSAKEEKVIRRKLACVLTAGTLVDGSMLQDDMSTYCVSVKEALVDDMPAFGVSFVDTATGQFFLSEFKDDMDMTKFETLVAQIRPQELLLEKSFVSRKALRILKNNTGPTTIWNYLKPGKEFWEANVTVRELDASKYFVSDLQDDLEVWPQTLRDSRNKGLVMSAFGALVQYLRMLQIDRDLVTIGNFTWYDPIKKASSLVLDGQTLINLEVFANSFDGGQEGTLFQLLNRCVTPFGKRTFKQWVCHPLVDRKKINARLDAVDSLNSDSVVRDQFSSQLTKMPDLERLISRVHAGSCKAQDFIRVLEGFEQIDYTMSLLKDMGAGDGVIGQLLAAMPDLDVLLEYWKTAFDRTKARDSGILVPGLGVEEDFDKSQDRICELEDDLQQLLKRVRRELGSSAIVYRDSGKEIYQLEVPIKVKNIPKHWDQMSATKQVKRYYFTELRTIIRTLQEVQETHNQIVKDVAARFYARFDMHYPTWLDAIRVVAQLDCLISLAKASSAIGYPSCRPTFVEDERSVIEFQELRHPCMTASAGDFIPNDVKLGGDMPNINLLTGANAAGKSTVLRMSCTAVIMAQIGCYVPCQSACLTPVDRIMSRLGANDNIFAAQSTFFVELSETKKILAEATPRSLVILDELGRGTSSYDGVAVAQAVLHHIATHIGALGFFATHYHSLAAEFEGHPEILARRMRIDVDDEQRRVTFLYKLEDGVAEGSFGMHCAAMCGIPMKVVEHAEVAAKQWEHTSRLKESLQRRKGGGLVGLGWWSDVAWLLKDTPAAEDDHDAVTDRGLGVLLKAIEQM